MFGLISRMIFLSSFLFNLKIHRNYVLPTLLYAVILKYYLSQSSHFKVILSPRDTPQWFCGFLCLFFTSVYPWERIDTPVSKNNTRWCFEDDLCIEHFKKVKVKDVRMLLRATWSLYISFGHLIVP